MDILKILKQKKPFKTIEEEVTVTLMYMMEQLKTHNEKSFKEFEITSTQYNILRILNGSMEEGRTCGEISQRLITKVPDITRLIDRMEKKELVRRERSATDKRVVRVFIMPKGIDIIEKSHGIIEKDNKMLFRQISKEMKENCLRFMHQLCDNISEYEEKEKDS